MKHLLAAFFIFALIIKAGAQSQWTQQNVYEALKNDLTEYSKNNPPKKNQTYWTLSFPTNKPREDDSKPWASSKSTVFADKNGKVYQVALESYGCNMDDSIENQNEVRLRFQSLVKMVSLRMFRNGYEISENDYKKLGPHLDKMPRVDLNPENSGVKKMKLRNGRYKCDAKGGYGYRLDFYL